jgi:hypothetical protein
MRFLTTLLLLSNLIAGCQKSKADKVSSSRCAASLDGHVYSNGVPQGQPLRNSLTFESGKVRYSNDDAVYPSVAYLCQDRNITWTASETKFEAEIVSTGEIKFFSELLKLEK